MQTNTAQINEPDNNSILLALLQNSLFTVELPNHILNFITAPNWREVYHESTDQSVIALALQGLFCLPKEYLPPEDLLREWKGQVFKEILSNERLISEQSEVLKILSSAGIKTAILKGTSSSRFYPKPELRALGDIDLLIDPRDMDMAVSVLLKNGYYKNEDKHDFHVSLDKNVHVELHHEISYLPNDKIGNKIREAMKDALDQTEICTLDNARFSCLSPLHNALVLLLHMERHMKNCGIGLRHLCDWAVFVNNNSQPELWGRLLPFLNEIGLFTFAKAVTLACVIYLGLSQSKCAWCAGASAELCARVIQEILASGNFGRKTGPERGTSGIIACGFISNINRRAKTYMPICKKALVLLPIGWIYVLLRYTFQIFVGKKPKQSVTKVTNLARERKKLFIDLGIYNR